jgi:hypothetical protein
MPPSTTLMQELSTYSGSSFANNAEVAGAISDGFNTTAFPAAIAPMTGSIESTKMKEK